MLSRRSFLKWIAALGAVGASTTAYAVAEPFLTRVTRYDIRPRRWNGPDLTLAAIADLHACRPWMSPERIASIVTQTNSLGADLVVLLGDYVAGMKFVEEVHSSEWAPALGQLKAPLGVHAVLGNHDWWSDKTAQRNGAGPTYSRRALEAAGIAVYENDAVRLTKDGRPFWLAGLGDQIAYLPSRQRGDGRPIGADDLDKTMAAITDDAPVMLLAHEPDVFRRVADRVSLVLSGHTHGGQVRLFGWSPVVPSRYGNRYAYGHVSEHCDLVVSGGLGCSIYPVRFGVPPEIVLIRLGAPTV